MKTTPIAGTSGQSVCTTRWALSAVSMAALGLAATGVQAAPVNVTLCAQAFTQPVTTTVSVPMWGYSLGACGVAAPSAPGPVLTLAPGDGPLVVTLINNLPVPTSLVLAGQGLPAGSAPVFATDVQDAAGSTICTPSPADTACRVRSFTAETPAGGTQTYTFNNLRSGTYLYQSGTHPQVQVQMGLFGMAKQDAAAGQLFAGRPYALDVPIVLSEIDPDMHQRIADTLGTAGNQAAWKATNNSTLTYSPKYFLINGKVFDGTTATDLPVATFNGANVVLRLANAGLQSRSLMLNGGHWSLLTEDGFPYPAPREQYTALLPAGKTTDAMIVANVPATGTNASLAIFDRRGGTHNADGGALGGQVARLAMSAPIGPLLNPVPNQVVNEGTNWTYQLVGTNATSYALTSAPVDAGWTFNAGTGLMNWNPVPLNTVAGTSYAMSATVSDGTATSPAQSFTLRINHTPALAAPGPISVSHGTVTVAAADLLSNASDPDGDVLAAVQMGMPSAGTLTLNANGSFTWNGPQPPSGTSTVTFAVAARDPFNLQSLPATVTLNVAANVPPSATNDQSALAPRETITLASNALGKLPLSITPNPLNLPVQPAGVRLFQLADIIGNDTDADGRVVNIQVTGVTRGTVNGAGAFTPVALPANNGGTWAEATVTAAPNTNTAFPSGDGTGIVTFTPRTRTSTILGSVVVAFPNGNLLSGGAAQTTLGVYRVQYRAIDDQGALSATTAEFFVRVQ